MLDFLKLKYHEHARELYDESSQTTSPLRKNSSIKRHLIIFNPANNDCLLRFTLSIAVPDVETTTREPEVNSVHQKMISKISAASSSRLALEVFSVSREGYWAEAAEKHIDTIVQSICLWLVGRVAAKLQP